VNRDARQLASIHNVNKNLNLALYPTFNLLNRSLSNIAHVSRAVLSITNALNAARLSGNIITQQEVENNRRMNEIQRELATNTNLTTQEIRALQEEYNQLARVNQELKNQNVEQTFSDWLTVISSVTFGIGVFGKQALQVIPHLGKLQAAIISMNVRLNLSLGLLGLISVAFTTIALASHELSNMFLTSLIPTLGELEYFYWTSIQPMFADWGEWLTVIMPGAFVAFSVAMQEIMFKGFHDLWNGLIQIINSGGRLIVDGINSIVRAVVNAINALIALYNRAARRLGRPLIQPVQFTPIQFTPIGEMPQNTVSVSQALTNPEFAQTVTTRPRAGRGGSAGNIINVNIQGSAIMEKELFGRVAEYIKDELKRRGL